jgi:hypothetical protein
MFIDCFEKEKYVIYVGAIVGFFVGHFWTKLIWDQEIFPPFFVENISKIITWPPWRQSKDCKL